MARALVWAAHPPLKWRAAIGRPYGAFDSNLQNALALAFLLPLPMLQVLLTSLEEP